MKNLKFDINAFCVVEQITGYSIPEIISNEQLLQKITLMRALFYGARLHENPKMSLADAGCELQEALSTGVDYAEVAEAISEAIIKSGIMPDSSEIEELELENPQTEPSVKA